MNKIEPTQHPFPHVWMGGDLGDYRICDSTYNGYELASLPPLPFDKFEGDFQWLLGQPSPFDFDDRFRQFWSNYDSVEKWKAEAPECKSKLLVDCAMRGALVPNAFFTFMDSIELVTRLRSPTDCYFEYPRTLIPYPTSHGGHFLHFYSDSQHCCLWYLYIDPQQRCAVVVSDDLSEPHDDDFWCNERGHIMRCAPSFESFIYRLWIEDEIWFRLVNNDQPLTPEMTEYLRFYKPDG